MNKMNKSDFEFWDDSAHTWANMIKSSGIFIEYDINVRNYDSALEQIDIMRKKLAHLSECIKELKGITS